MHQEGQVLAESRGRDGVTRRFARRAASIGTVGLAVSAAIVLSATSAQAVTWYRTVPEKATNVFNVAEKTMSDGKTVLQIRYGKYNGNVYLWGRVAYPTSTYNSGHDLAFSVSGDCLDGGSSKITMDIDTTTYSSAAKNKLDCLYAAQIVKRSTGRVVGTATYHS